MESKELVQLDKQLGLHPQGNDMKTLNLKPQEIQNNWVVVDATGLKVGRLASEISRVLRGKHKPTFTPNLDCGDHVVVINAEKVSLSGNKWEQKHYYRHTGYIGGIKSTRADKLNQTYPERIIQFAVKGMLPKNKLSRHQMKKLKVYAGTEHPHKAQNPAPMAARTVKEG